MSRNKEAVDWSCFPTPPVSPSFYSYYKIHLQWHSQLYAFWTGRIHQLKNYQAKINYKSKNYRVPFKDVEDLVNLSRRKKLICPIFEVRKVCFTYYLKILIIKLNQCRTRCSPGFPSNSLSQERAGWLGSWRDHNSQPERVHSSLPSSPRYWPSTNRGEIRNSNLF